jgi:hypothetical protein
MKRCFCGTVLLTVSGVATAQAIRLEPIQVSPRVWYFGLNRVWPPS